MVFRDELTEEERGILAPILRTLSIQARLRITLESLLDSWSQMVNEIETGYEESIDDYVNDLFARTLLHEIADQVPSTLRAKLEMELVEVDARFWQATRDSTLPLLAVPTSPEEWWWHRLPRHPKGRLAESIRHMESRAPEP